MRINFKPFGGGDPNAYPEDYHDYQEQEHLMALYKIHEAEAIATFSEDRLKSAYRAHPTMAAPVVNLLMKADQEDHPVMEFLYNVIATEMTIRDLLTRPIVKGLVHNDAVTDIVLGLVPREVGRLKELLFNILKEVVAMDFIEHKRPGAKLPLWEEWKIAQNARHALMHSGEMPSPEIMSLAVMVSHEFINGVFPAVLDKLGLHVDGNFRIEG